MHKTVHRAKQYVAVYTWDRGALGGFTASTFSSWWQQRISVALQLGNARCIIERARRDQPQGGVMEGHDDSHLAPCEVQ